MENNINNEIYNKFKENCLRGQVRDPFQDNFEFEEKMAKYYNIRKFVLNKIYRIRILLVLGLKQITWRKELENKFDLHPKHITEFFEFMKENNMILFKPITEVDNILFESVTKQNGLRFYSQRDLVKVYTLTPEGQEICKKLMEDLLKLTNERTDLQNYVNEIMSKTEKHRKVYNNILEEERTLLERKIVYPDGFIETRTTLRAKELDKQITNTRKEILLEKQRTKKLTKLEENSLVLLSNTEIALNQESKEKRRNIIEYKGIHKNLSKNQLQKLSDGVSNEEEKEVLKELEKDKTQRIERFKESNKKALEDDYTRLVYGGMMKRVRELEKDKSIFDLLGIE